MVAASAAVVALFGILAWNNLRLEDERDRARRGEAKAAAVARFLTDVFAEADPDQSRGADLTAREILARGAERIDERLADEPAVQAALLDALGRVHQSLAMYDEGRTLLERSLALKRATFAGDDPELAETAYILGGLEAEVGRFERADSLLTAALAIRRAQSPPPSTRTIAHIQQYRALVALRLGDNDAALRLYDEALAGYEVAAADGGDREALSVCMNDKALLLLELGRRDEAEPLFRRALASQAEHLGRDHPEYANTLFNLSLLLREKGDHAAAEPVLREVLELDRKHYDANHPMLAYSLMSLAGSLEFTGRLKEAEPLFAEALAIRQASLEPGHPNLIKAIGTLGLNLERQGRYREAEPLLQEAVDMALEHLGKHRITAGRLDDLGWLMRDTGRYDESLALHRQALEIKLEVLGPEHTNVAITLMQMARTLVFQNRLGEARDRQEEALGIAREQGGEDNVFTATNELGLARILLLQGDVDGATQLADKGLLTMRRLQDDSSTRLAGALEVRGSIHRAAGALDEAERLLRQGLAIRSRVQGDGNPATAWSRVRLAQLLKEQGRSAEARQLARVARPVLEAALRRITTGWSRSGRWTARRSVGTGGRVDFGCGPPGDLC